MAIRARPAIQAARTPNALPFRKWRFPVFLFCQSLTATQGSFCAGSPAIRFHSRGKVDSGFVTTSVQGRCRRELLWRLTRAQILTRRFGTLLGLYAAANILMKS